MRFLHVADIHLDSPMRRLRRMGDDAHAALINCTRAALTNLVDFAVDPENAIDFVVIAGDVFDGTWKDYQTGLFFQNQMLRLKHAGIPVVAIRGNHDAQSKMIRDLSDWRDTIRFLGADAPETISGKDLGLDVDVLIHGQSFREGAMPDNLAVTYPAGDRGAFNLGLLHTSFAGYPGHDPYAPCGLDDLRRKEYGYWALGHIHQRHALHGKSDAAEVHYAGNVQGRHIREEGPKGALVVTVDGSGRASTDFVAFDVLRWKHVRLTLEPRDSLADCLGKVEEAFAEAYEEREGREVAVRLTVEGRAAAHREFSKAPEGVDADIRALAEDVGRGAFWIEEIRFRTRGAYDRTKLAQDDGPAGELVRWFDAAGGGGNASLASDDDSASLATDEAFASLASDDGIAALLKKLPREFRERSSFDPEAAEFLSEEHLRRLLPRAEALLLDAVLGDEDA